MKQIKTIFITLLTFALFFTNANATNCKNKIYRLHNPEKCIDHINDSELSFAGTLGATTGALAIIGSALGLLGLQSNNEHTNDHPSLPTLPKYDMVGADVDYMVLSSIINDTEYTKNSTQYNDIRLAYSLARGFTGNGSEIAIFDSGQNTFHGGNVAYFASGQIAPNASVSSYMVADRYGDFKTFYEIGDIINSATNANIYNFSWSAGNSFVTDIRNRQQMINATDENFINSLINSATNQDAIFVWAAGNNGATESSALSALPIHINELMGHFVNVVAWDSETGTLADFSNYCGMTKNFCITAPGTNLESPKSENPLNGTSFATPIVSAAIAVIREAFPYMKSTEITNLLFTTARDLGAEGVDEVYGHGMLDLERATRPVGAPLVPISEDFGITMRTSHISAPIGQKIMSKKLTFAFVDKFGRAFNTNMNDNIIIKNRSIAQEHLSTENEKSIKLNNLELGFKKTDLFNGDGFLKTDSENIMTFVRHKRHTNIGNLRLFHHSSLGITSPKNNSESMISNFSNIYTASITIGAAYGDFSFSVGTPDTIIYGNINLNTLQGRTINGDYIFTNNKIDLTSVPSIEFQARYKSFIAGFVNNPSGPDEIYVLAKTKLSF